MMTIPLKVSDTQIDLYIILEDENIERIKQYDPAEVVRKLMPATYQMGQIRNVVICYANKADIATIMPMFENGDLFAALRHLSRGWRYRPDSGDSDGDYESLLRRQ